MKEKFLTRILYASTATTEFNPSELANILEAARSNNVKQSVTGMLFVDNNFFLQCLEGPRDGVNKIFRQLINDPRHDDVQILEAKEVADRYFGGWTMKYVPSAGVIKRILQETGLRQFNPYMLDNYTLNAMLTAFRDHQDVKETTRNVKQERSFLGGLFNRD